jgi:L-lactate dehydrogenase
MRHAKIAIIGSGAVGASTAYAIMWKNIAAELMLVDMDEKRCRGEIMDLSDAISFSCTSCLRQATLAEAGQADIIILSAGVRQKPGQLREELLQVNWSTVESIVMSMQPINKRAILVVVTNPVDSMAYCAQCVSGLAKQQVFGTGTFLDTQRLKGLISHAVSVAEQSVDVYMLGAHGSVQFASWSCASIAGIPAAQYPGMSNDMFDAMVKETTHRVYEIIDCKGATYYGIAACVADICECIIFNQRRALPLSSYIPEFGISLSLPVILGERGIEKIVPIPLNNVERQELQKASQHLISLVNQVKK